MSKLRRCAAAVAAGMFLACGLAAAQDVTAAARDIAQKNQESVVPVRLVIRMQYSAPGSGSQQQESRTEIVGTVIDPSGLTLVSLSETDPASAFRRMYGAQAREVQIETEVTDARIIRADGSEVAARIVLRDRDLDMAFLRPVEAPATPFVAADLTQAGQAQLLDQILILSRLGRVANRAYGAAMDRVQAVVERPRTFYVPVGADPSGGLGSPVYTLDGKILGVTLMRAIQVEGGGSSIVVVVPASDIQEAAAQAPSVEEAAKQEAEEKAKEPPAAEEPAPEGQAPEGQAPEGEQPPAPGAEPPAEPAEPATPAPAEPAPPSAAL